MGESCAYSLLLSVLVDFSPHTSKAQSKSWQFWATWHLQLIFTKPELMSFLLTGNISLRVKCSDPLKISMDRAIQLKSLKVKIHLIDILSSTNLNRDSEGPLFPWKQSIGRAFLLWGESLQFVLSDRPNSDVVVI